METEDTSSNDSFKSSNRKPSSRGSSQSNEEVSNTAENEAECLNMSHNDLSDVSDLESDEKSNTEKLENEKSKDLRKKLEEIKGMDNSNGYDVKEKRTDEDVLDFEAEEGECNDEKDDILTSKDDPDKKIELSEPEEGEELEEGELSEEDGKRPEENEPKPVCRFYTRGQCTWGMSCRFLHPGVTDKGNYTMFDMVRPVPAPHFNEFRDSRPQAFGIPSHHSFGVSPYARPPITPTAEVGNESAWERGLRTAKEMMRKASKRKEQDIDFEDKKMNLSLSQEELEKDNYYIRDRGPTELSPTYKAYSPGRPMVRSSLEEDSFGRVQRYRDINPPHRSSYYDDPEKRRNRPMREVIVQKADQWSDPWMRSKDLPAPTVGGRRGGNKRDRRSYSSNSSYSSSSSSNSNSSSESSSSSTKHRRLSRHKSRDNTRNVSSYKKRPKTGSVSPALRTNISSPKHYDRRASPPSDRRFRGGLSPKRKIHSPRKTTGTTVSNKKRDRSSSSNSESSESSGSSESSESSESSDDSSDESSSAKHGRTRDKILHERKIATKKVEMSRKKSPMVNDEKGKASGSKKSNRREELLKQLKAVEDAIARKRSKIN
ncbi:zinc finger CCCH domain-containing protein 18 isoform X2 [Culicoides brevitarsis]